jgi:hypothetical protein
MDDLFGTERRTGTDDVVRAFRQRLVDVAGFKYVPEPIPLRNNEGATVYYLFFASPNAVGDKIVRDIFDKYRVYGQR